MGWGKGRDRELTILPLLSATSLSTQLWCSVQRRACAMSLTGPMHGGVQQIIVIKFIITVFCFCGSLQKSCLSMPWLYNIPYDTKISYPIVKKVYVCYSKQYYVRQFSWGERCLSVQLYAHCFIFKRREESTLQTTFVQNERKGGKFEWFF